MKTQESGDTAPHILTLSYQLEVSSQLHAPVTLPLRKELYKAGRVPEQAWTRCEKNKDVPAVSQTSIVHPVA
jgi:hypothetical protein